MTEPLPRTAPRLAGVRASGVLALVEALEQHPDVEPHGLVLLRHGAVVAEGWWAPFRSDRLHLLYSLSKSFTASALALAVGEGLVGLDDPVVEHFPSIADGVRDDRTRRIRVRHLAAMASGHRDDVIDRVLAAYPLDPVASFLAVPPDEEPGSVFAYNQPCTYTVGAIVADRAGESLEAYLRRRLLSRIGVDRFAWQRGWTGRALGYSGMFATTESVARLGELYLRDGRWGDEQVLPPGWVAQASSVQVPTADEESPDWKQGYGFQLWRSRHGYRGDGAYGQFCLVLPEQDAVVALTSASPDMQAVLDVVWEHLLPAMVDGPVDDPDAGRADAELAARLAALALPPVDGSPEPVAQQDRAAPGPVTLDVPLLRDLGLGPGRLTRDGDRWVVSLPVPDGAAELLVPFADGGWHERDLPLPDGTAAPVAVSGAWQPDVARLDVLFLETPHRLVVRVAPGGDATGEWVAEPLGGLRPDAVRAPAPPD